MSNIKLVGYKKLTDLIQDKKNNLKDTEKFFDKLGLKYVQLVQLSFRNSRNPFGTKWKKLKSREGQPLKDSGRLSNSISHERTKNGVRVFVEGDLQYAQVHNNGFKGNVNVSAHNRKITQAFGKKINQKTIKISTFIRKMNIPKRQFIPNKGRLPIKWYNVAEELLLKQIQEGK